MNDEEINESTHHGADEPHTDEFAALIAENEQLKSEIRLNNAQRLLTDELALVGARSPRLMFDAVRGELQFGLDGQLEDTSALVEGLKQRFPEQFGNVASRQSIDAGAGVANRPQLTRAALARMKPAEIAELDWTEVRRVLAG